MRYIQKSSTEDSQKYLRELLSRFNNLPDEDSPDSIKHLIGLLNELLRLKNITPPTVEIMTILKHQKSTLYHSTKRSITSTSHLSLLFQLETDPILAEERLNQLMIQ